jgi:hypothetical protein
LQNFISVDKIEKKKKRKPALAARGSHHRHRRPPSSPVPTHPHPRLSSPLAMLVVMVMGHGDGDGDGGGEGYEFGHSVTRWKHMLNIKNLNALYIQILQVKKTTRFRFEWVRTEFKKFPKSVNQNWTTYLGAWTEPEPEPNLGPVRRFRRFWTGSEPNFGIPRNVGCCPGS